MVRAYITWNFHGRAVPGPERQGTLMRTLAQLGARPCLSLELIEECRGHDLRLQRMFQDAFRMPDARDHVAIDDDDWYDTQAASGFRIAPPTPVFPRLELPAEPSA